MASWRLYLLCLPGLLAALVLLPFLAVAQAPVFDRAQVVGAAPAGGGNSTVKALALDALGNQYVAGTFTGTVSVGPTSFTVTYSNLAYPADAFVGKLDPNGNWLWVVRTGGGAASIDALTTDATGNVYAGGTFTSAQFQFGTRTLNNSSNQAEAFIAKLDAQGNCLWAKRAGGTGQEGVTGLALAGTTLHACGYFESVTADFGQLTLTNNYTRGDGSADIFVAALDAATGAWTSAYRAGGTNTDYATAVAADAQGNIYITGIYSGTSAAFGPVQLTASSRTSKVYVAKLVSGRGWRWAVAPGHSGVSLSEAWGRAIAVSGQARVTVVGSFSSWLQFNSTVLNSNGSGIADGVSYPLSDAFVAQLDSAGVWQWAVQPVGQGSEGATSVAVDGWGNPTVAISFDRDIDFGSGQVTSPGIGIALARLSSTGAWSWITTCNGGRRAQLLDNGADRLYLAGTFGPAAASFGPHTLPANPGQPYSSIGTGFLARLSSTTLAAAPPKSTADWSVYPNPARQYVAVSGLPARTTVEVVDALGRRVTDGITPSQGTLRLQLPPGLPAGLYVVRSGPRCLRLLVE